MAAMMAYEPGMVGPNMQQHNKLIINSFRKAIKLSVETSNSYLFNLLMRNPDNITKEDGSTIFDDVFISGIYRKILDNDESNFENRLILENLTMNKTIPYPT